MAYSEQYMENVAENLLVMDWNAQQKPQSMLQKREHFAAVCRALKNGTTYVRQNITICLGSTSFIEQMPSW